MKKLLILILIMILAIYAVSIFVFGQTKEETTEDIFEYVENGVNSIKSLILGKQDSL